MNPFGITFKNEMIRMIHRRKLLTGILVAAIIPILIVLAKVLALGWDIPLIYREDLFRMALSLFTPMILPLFSIVLVADAFTDEHSKGSLKTSLLLPDSRTGHFMAKIISSVTGASAMLFALWFSSLVFGLILPSRGGWILSLGMGLLQCLASLLPIIVVLGFSSLASQTIKSGSGMILSLIGLTLVMRLLPLWLGDLSRILPTTWLGFGANIGYLPLASLLYALTGMLLWTVFTGGLALLRFESKMI